MNDAERIGAHDGPTRTHFLLVPGAFTGGWVWEETAARLRAAGAGAHTVTLVGPEGARGSGAAPDLEAYIGEVVRVIDAVGRGGPADSEAADLGDPAGPGDEAGSADADAAARDIVLVGHGYGLHPALGAADRRPGLVARLVALDTAPPQDGHPAWATVPDQGVREELAARAGSAEPDGGPLPPPDSAAAWRRWGSTDGLPGPALERLIRDAVPQPLHTLLQPLHLTGAATDVPTTGVLCTANGASIDLVQMRVSLGDPAFQPLTAPGVRFLELPTGHWPMLSCPDGLADVLLRAAAGEGRRLTLAGSQPPPHLRPFVLDVPEVPCERNETIDLYLPGGDGPHPAVIVVHGGPIPEGIRPTPREWPTLTGYARLAAAHGAVGVTFDHRLYDIDGYPRAAEDVAAAVARVREDPRVDGDRIALWFFSGGGLLAADWLSAPPPWLRCIAASYPILAPLPNWGLDGDRFRPAAALRGAGDLPLVVVRAGRELPEIAATVTEFLTAAEAHGATLEVIDVPDGHHGFETADHHSDADPAALRTAVRSALRTVLGRLTDR
ncbi:dienelactone hydrolase family protein [Streptomyces benahoarensis]|uniref:Alpha/beta hydrolase n=1 Tax=Streptomyces benahoarensis TaxID=2595054 RepID=A0A553ZML6_9ACTN|nr:alpha/beta hydrolase [Streptomyces benahoarensis]TSB28908.1 alpha/beta hydrolase [Streptomyces benahoarensis]TSB42680.1 alpha/beta hydrolase [Streptomyces benahoarensis]